MDPLDRTIAPTVPVYPVTDLALTLPDLFLRRVRRSRHSVAFRRKVDGQWVATTWEDFDASAQCVATWLLDQGIALGDKLTIVGSTRPEWCIADVGGLLAGAITVGAYPTLTAEQLGYILEHSDTRMVFVEDREQLEKVLTQKSRLPKLERAVLWEERGAKELLDENDWIVPWSSLLEAEAATSRVEERASRVEPSNTAIIVYTSGTTGPPKGAMISHENILVLLRGAIIMELDRNDEGLVFLPMAHVAERIMSFYGRIAQGTAAAYASSIPAVLEEVQEVRPTLFGSVPRIFEKAYDKIQAEVEKASPSKQRVFRWAEGTAREMVRVWQAGESPSLGLQLRYRAADRLVFSKLRRVFGGRVKYFVTGAAPIARDVLDFFWGAGFPIYEVYGMTEATVVTHANRPGATRLGSVGKPLGFVEDRLAEDGEILIRGKTVFQGYYKNPEATAEAIDAEGWLHTGDIGKRDADGYLYIVDRKKHLIITAGGKNLTPANIENTIKTRDPIISYVHAHGDRRAYVTALLTLSPLESLDYALGLGLVESQQEAEEIRAAIMENPFARPPALTPILKQLSDNPKLHARIIEAVRRGNEQLSRVESVKRVIVLDRDLSLDEDEITPTLKVKRKNLEKKFATLFDELYADPQKGLTIEDQ